MVWYCNCFSYCSLLFAFCVVWGSFIDAVRLVWKLLAEWPGLCIRQDIMVLQNACFLKIQKPDGHWRQKIWTEQDWIDMSLGMAMLHHLGMIAMVQRLGHHLSHRLWPWGPMLTRSLWPRPMLTRSPWPCPMLTTSPPRQVIENWKLRIENILRTGKSSSSFGWQTFGQRPSQWWPWWGQSFNKCFMCFFLELFI